MTVPTALLAYAFRSCVAFYNAKPWKVFGPADAVHLTLNGNEAWLAHMLGNEGGAVGFLLSAASRDLTREGTVDGADENASAGLSMMFVPEADAPQPMRDARRANKWPLASPAAFPTFLAIDAEGVTPELSPNELRTLSVAMSVITLYVATRRKLIETRQPHADALTVRDDTGVTCVALVQFPPFASDESWWQSFKIGDTNGPSNPALRELTNTALDLPDAEPILDRLVWSFFQSAIPGYVPDDDAQEDAYQRFVFWAIFARKAQLGTLAERALQQLETTRTSEALEMHRRVVNPRAGIFRVLDVKRNVGMSVRDEARGDILYVVERTATRRLRADSGVLGMLHPISDTQWILAPGASLYPSLPPMSSHNEESETGSFAPAMEASVYGAGTEWIQMTEAEEIEDEYESFAGSLRATGDMLPAYAQLQQQIARADQPGDVAREIGNAIEWWSDFELNVALAFVMRIWNATPRDELGGKSPDAMVVGRGRVRATRPTGGRRRT